MVGMIGVDMVYIPEFALQAELGGDTLLNKTFNPEELANRGINHLAGLWAAKEAVYKAAEKSPKTLKDIIISHDNLGKPSARIAKQSFDISISHHGDYAIAVALRLSK
jgi:NAD(P)H-hydrate epimerase